MVIGALLMVFLWFRPQGIVPERPRKTSLLLPGMSLGEGATAVTVSQSVTVGAEPVPTKEGEGVS
jgi:hypothetical protein